MVAYVNNVRLCPTSGSKGLWDYYAVTIYLHYDCCSVKMLILMDVNRLYVLETLNIMVVNINGDKSQWQNGSPVDREGARKMTSKYKVSSIQA